VTAAEIARLAENALACVTGLVLVGALMVCAAVKCGWVRFSLSFAVIPLERRGQAPAAADGAVPIEKGRAA
jgi:hypothetical protein